MTIRQVSLAPVREGLEPGTPLSEKIPVLGRSICASHMRSAISSSARLFLHLFALQISEGESSIRLSQRAPHHSWHRWFGESGSTCPQSGARDVVVRHG